MSIINVVSGPNLATVIRDRYPTWDENTALLKASGKWLVYSPHAKKLFEYEFSTYDDGLKESGTVFRAVSFDGEPLALDVSGTEAKNQADSP